MASPLSDLVDNLTEVNACLAIKITQASLMKNWKRDWRTHSRFRIMISINLVCC